MLAKGLNLKLYSFCWRLHKMENIFRFCWLKDGPFSIDFAAHFLSDLQSTQLSDTPLKVSTSFPSDQGYSLFHHDDLFRNSMDRRLWLFFLMSFKLLLIYLCRVGKSLCHESSWFPAIHFILTFSGTGRKPVEHILTVNLGALFQCRWSTNFESASNGRRRRSWIDIEKSAYYAATHVFRRVSFNLKHYVTSEQVSTYFNLSILKHFVTLKLTKWITSTP